MSDLETDVEGIGHLLSDRMLAIPDFQRSYSWTLDEVSELWDDIKQAIDEKSPEYFLGSVVTTSAPGETRDQVIDGQQRLATISLLLAAVRDILKAGSDAREQKVESKVLGDRNLRTKMPEPRLILNADDNELFRSLTLPLEGQVRPTPQTASHKRLLASYDFLHTKLEELISGLRPNEWQGPLFDWYEYLLKQACVIHVTVSDEDRAFEVFETLNDRGLNLSTSDLLKNYLFRRAGGRMEEAKSKWTRAMATLAAAGLDGNEDTFLRHVWASKKGVVRVKALYSLIKKDITSQDDAIRFAAELAECAPLWTAMYDRDADAWKGMSAGTRAAVDTLKNLAVEQCRPLLLAALRRLDGSDVERLLRYLVDWSVRWLVVGGGSAGTVERLYATAAQRVTDGGVTSVSQVRELFLSKVPVDAAFKDSFGIMAVKKPWQARYYLTVLENASKGDCQPELVPNEDVEKVNLEHVLPKNPSPEWLVCFTPDEAQAMTLMLGNQVLLRERSNRAVGNAAFATKKAVLADSRLALTKEVGLSDDWTPDRIRERQGRLAELAVNVWKR